jgi:hypothetical protein
MLEESKYHKDMIPDHSKQLRDSIYKDASGREVNSASIINRNKF